MSNPLNTSQLARPDTFGSVPPGYIAGYATSNAPGDLEHDILVDIGVCAGQRNLLPIALQAPTTKRIDALFAEGDGNGGLDLGTVAADELYAVYIIDGPDKETDVVFSLDRVAPSLPSGFTDYRRVQWILTDSSANIRRYFQTPLDTTFLATAIIDIVDNTAVNNTFEIGDVSAPPVTMGLFVGLVETPQNAFTGLFVATAEFELLAGAASTDAVIYVDGNNIREVAARFSQQVGPLRQLAYAGTAGGGTVSEITIATLGWVDQREHNQLL